MTPEVTLWAETQRAPLVASKEHEECVVHKRCIFTTADGDTCGGTGEVRNDVYRAIEHAITVPCPTCFGTGALQQKFPPDYDEWRDVPCDNCNGTGRAVRPQPGVMACPCYEVRDFGSRCAPCQHSVFTDGPNHIAACKTCGGSGTVPDPSEAGVVARLEALGRLIPLVPLFGPVGVELLGRAGKASTAQRLLNAILNGDYPGALAIMLAVMKT